MLYITQMIVGKQNFRKKNQKKNEKKELKIQCNPISKINSLLIT